MTIRKGSFTPGNLTDLGLGSMASQDSNSIDVTGGTAVLSTIETRKLSLSTTPGANDFNEILSSEVPYEGDVPFTFGSSIAHSTNLTTISLTPGTWRIYGMGAMSINSSTLSRFYAYWTDSNNSVWDIYGDTLRTACFDNEGSLSLYALSTQSLSIPVTIYTTATNKTIYLNLWGTWGGGGNAIGWGQIIAERIVSHA